MALTAQERARLTEAMNTQEQPKTSALTASERAQLEALQKESTLSETSAVDIPDKNEGILMRSARAVQAIPSKILDIPGVKQVTEISSLPFVQASKGIGQIVGAVGTPIANIIKGRPTFENLGQNIQRTGEDTAQFSRDLTSQTPIIAAQQTLGRVPNLILGGSQVVTGASNVVKGLREGDKQKALTGGIEAGLGVLGLIGASRQKGTLLDKQVSEPIVSHGKAVITGKTLPQVRQESYEKEIKKAEPVMRDILQITAPQSRKIQRGLLQEARLKRAGIEVEPKTPIERTLLEEQIFPKEMNVNGRKELDTSQNQIDLDQKIEAANDLLERSLSVDKNPAFDLLKMGKESLNSIDEIKNISATERKSMKAEVSQFFKDEIAAKGRYINAEQANQVKRGFQKAGDYKNLSPGQKHIRQSAGIIRKAIEDYFGDKLPIKQANRLIGDLIEARDFLALKHGQVIKGGLLGKKLASLTGAVVGSSLSRVPLVGELLGYKAGEMLTDMSISPARKLAPFMGAIERVQPKSDKTLTNLQSKEGVLNKQLKNMPRLPAPAPSLPTAQDTSGIVPGYTPKQGVQVMRPGQKALPPGMSVIEANRRSLPQQSYTPTKSGILSQKQAVSQLKSEGYTGPLTKREMKESGEQAMSDAQYEKDLVQQLKKDSYQAFNIQGINEDEIQLAYARFKALANRSNSTLDPSVDAATLQKRLGTIKYGKLMRPTSGGNLTDDELLDLFKNRFLAEQALPF